MSNLVQTKETEYRTETAESRQDSQKPSDKDILDTTDIQVEEVAIDGICGVY